MLRDGAPPCVEGGQLAVLARVPEHGRRGLEACLLRPVKPGRRAKAVTFHEGHGSRVNEETGLARNLGKAPEGEGGPRRGREASLAQGVEEGLGPESRPRLGGEARAEKGEGLFRLAAAQEGVGGAGQELARGGTARDGMIGLEDIKATIAQGFRPARALQDGDPVRGITGPGSGTGKGLTEPRFRLARGGRGIEDGIEGGKG